MLTFLYTRLLWSIAGLISGLTSFGGNLVAVPLCMLVWDPRDAIFAGCVAGTAISGSIFVIYRKHVVWREIFYLSLGLVPGIPLGVWTLNNVGSAILLLIASASMFFFLAIQFFCKNNSFTNKIISPCWAVPLGLLGGVLQASISMGGPPLVIYAFMRKWGKEASVANIACMVVITLIFWLPLEWEHLYNANFISVCAQCSVFAIAGVVVSVPVLGRVNIAFFRKCILVMIAFTAFILLTGGLRQLF